MIQTALLVLALVVSGLAQAQQQTVRDSSGRSLGTISTEGNVMVFRDHRGRVTAKATKDDNGTVTIRDPRGRTTGTATKDSATSRGNVTGRANGR